MKAERLGSLTDAVVAIVSTIMVLELAVPDNASYTSLIDQWPVFLAHFNSFFIIYILWYNHYQELSKLTYVSPKVILLNGVWLAILAIVPFSTGWVGEYSDSTYPELFYVIVLALCFILHQLIFAELAKENPTYKVEATNSFKLRIPIYICLVLAIGFSFFIPIISMAFVVMIVLINIYQIIKYGGHRPSS